MKITSGAHLGIMRNFIQWNAKGGDIVLWGSEDLIPMTPTVSQMEELAQEIRNGAIKEVLTYDIRRVCDQFQPSIDDNPFCICRNCNYSDELHNIKKELFSKK